MPCSKGLGNYEFCENSPYYNGLLEYFEKHKTNRAKIPETNCVLSRTTMKFKENLSAQNICKEFIILYKFFRDYKATGTLEKDFYSYTDCDFLNYWLNDKLRNSVIDGDEIDVRGFYQEINNMNQALFSKTKDLENYMNNIDAETLENMKLLYDLYYNKRKILNMLLGQDYTDPEKNPCSVFREDCHEKYVTAINKCYGINDEFYKALKDFKSSYNVVIGQGNKDIHNCRGSTNFLLPEYDPVLEKEEKKSILIQRSTSPLIFLLLLPMIYKFTSFGPYLQEKINRVKYMWKSPKKNKEKMLSSTMDIENNISDNRKYKLVYNSVPNE
ncbi:hypothetical protein PVT01_000081200 [Plasmodium vivax]|uniref:VIR protein n=1 Tax=Plasmodium vivax TaxID=5855 RepID=A0A1G4E7G5_PLAVI|nr:hypothetical protein PVT01_000081200 [Plasmodium vivax]